MFASEPKRTTRQASSVASPRRMRRELFSSGRSSTSNARANVKIFVIANVLYIWMAGASQLGSFEKQAISSTQATSASELDETLPDRPFERWFNKIIGPNAGVVWQLTERGGQVSATDKTEQ